MFRGSPLTCPDDGQTCAVKHEMEALVGRDQNEVEGPSHVQKDDARDDLQRGHQRLGKFLAALDRVTPDGVIVSRSYGTIR